MFGVCHDWKNNAIVHDKYLRYSAYCCMLKRVNDPKLARLLVDASLHRRLKKLAKQHGMLLSFFANKVITEVLDNTVKQARAANENPKN